MPLDYLRKVGRLRSSHTRAVLIRQFRDRFRSSDVHGAVAGTQSVGGFWDLAHREGYHLWLTGTDPDVVFSRLRVTETLQREGTDLTVLNVGVGEGYCTRRLVELTREVDVLDISEVANRSVADVTRRQYVDSSELSQGAYELILHHLVAQHMSHDQLQLQLADLVRSLTATGCLAIQYASSIDDPGFTTSECDDNLCKLGGVVRSEAYFREMVEKAGGSVIGTWPGTGYPEYGSRHVISHIASN